MKGRRFTYKGFARRYPLSPTLEASPGVSFVVRDDDPEMCAMAAKLGEPSFKVERIELPDPPESIVFDLGSPSIDEAPVTIDEPISTPPIVEEKPIPRNLGRKRKSE